MFFGYRFLDSLRSLEMTKENASLKMTKENASLKMTKGKVLLKMIKIIMPRSK